MAAFGLRWEVFIFYSVLSACEPVWERGAAVSGNLSNTGMDCYNHRVITPTSSTPATVYNMTVELPLSSAFTTFLSPHLLRLCWGSQFVFVSQWKPLTVSILEGNFCCIFVLFLFCKAYDSYCIRASSNNKNSIKLVLHSFLIFHLTSCSNGHTNIGIQTLQVVNTLLEL